MSANVPTFEEVDKHIQSADLTSIQAAPAGASPEAAIPNICGAYKIIRPILNLLTNVPLIPKKWKDAIKLFMSVMDRICP